MCCRGHQASLVTNLEAEAVDRPRVILPGCHIGAGYGRGGERRDAGPGVESGFHSHWIANTA
jgi:hypothetical protein